MAERIRPATISQPPRHNISLPVFRGMWRDQIFGDHELLSSAFRIGYALTTFMTMTDTAAHYRKTGKVIVWPSQEQIHLLCGLSLDTIHAGSSQLVKRGHVVLTKRGNQFNGSNHYCFILKDEGSRGLAA